MTPSEKRRLIIPANLGYGMRGAGGVIHGGMFDKFPIIHRCYARI